MAGWTNMLIEQCCGPICEGFAGACSQWLPHFCKTICDPCWEGLNNMFGK